MHIFWPNIFKFPKFFISVILGFILIVLKPLGELLKKRRQNIIIVISITILSMLLLKTLQLMLALN